MSFNNDGDASMVAGLNQLLDEDEREALEAERLRAAAIPPNPDDAFVNPFQGQDVRFELPPGMRRPGAAAAAGRAPSNGSTVSNGSVAVFGRANPHTLEEIQENEVLVRKDQCGTHSSKIFIAHCAAATMGLIPKFLGSQHLQSRNAEGENLQKASKLQEQFVSNLEVMAMFVVQMKQYDLSIPLQIPKEYFDVVNVED
jgi:hypothetical protein